MPYFPPAEEIVVFFKQHKILLFKSGGTVHIALSKAFPYFICQSEDMQLLEGELEMAREQLHLSKQLLNECVLARRRKKSREEQEKSNSSLQVMCRKSKKSGKARKSKLMSSKRFVLPKCILFSTIINKHGIK